MSGSGGVSGSTAGGSADSGRGGVSGADAGGGHSGGGAVNGGGAMNGAAGAGTGADGAGAAGAGVEAGGGSVGGAASGGTGGDAGAPAANDCVPGTGFVGQLTGPGSAPPNGGIFTTDPNSVAYGDANLDGVVAAYPDFDAVWDIDVDVDGAVVTATAGATPGPEISASRTDFWIADENVLLRVSLDPELGPSCCPDFDVQSGMRVSFKATQVSLFAGLGMITAASNFVAGEQGSCVLVTEPERITDVDFYQMIRISGQVTGTTCGSGDYTFWELGVSDAVLCDFLSPRSNLQTGQTVTFVGPVSPYVGFHMLVENNPDWVVVQ